MRIRPQTSLTARRDPRQKFTRPHFKMLTADDIAAVQERQDQVRLDMSSIDMNRSLTSDDRSYEQQMVALDLALSRLGHDLPAANDIDAFTESILVQPTTNVFSNIREATSVDVSQTSASHDGPAQLNHLTAQRKVEMEKLRRDVAMITRRMEKVVRAPPLVNPTYEDIRAIRRSKHLSREEKDARVKELEAAMKAYRVQRGREYLAFLEGASRAEIAEEFRSLSSRYRRGPTLKTEKRIKKSK